MTFGKYHSSIQREFPQLMADWKAQDAAMRYVRASVEHQYAHVKNEMQLSRRSEKFQLLAPGRVPQKTLLVMFFLTDLKTCMRGNQALSVFGVPPPSVDAYLKGLLWVQNQ